MAFLFISTSGAGDDEWTMVERWKGVVNAAGKDVKLHLLLTTFDDSLKDSVIDKSHIIIPMLRGFHLIYYRFYIDIKNKPVSIVFTYDNYVLTCDILQKYLKEHYNTTNSLQVIYYKNIWENIILPQMNIFIWMHSIFNIQEAD